jgi:hypothetical protein
MTENFCKVKSKGEELGLSPETIKQGLRLFNGTLNLILDDVKIVQMEILKLSEEDVIKLSELFNFAHRHKVKMYLLIDNGVRKLKMSSYTDYNKQTKHNQKDSNDTLEKLCEQAFGKNSDSFSDLFKNIF